ncbi:hypothetical protein [Brevundimonas sp.]
MRQSKICISAALAAVLLVAAPAQAHAQDPVPARSGTATIYRAINAVEMNRVLEGKDYASVVKENETDFAITTQSGFKFHVMLMACNIENQPAGCLGVSIRASWDLEARDVAILRPVIHSFNSEYRIGKALMLEDAIFIERYAIMDGGVTLEHLSNELIEFLGSADVLQTAMAEVLED